MREIEYKGIKSYITEKDWQNLLRRFDVKNAKKNGNCIIIPVSCRPCKKYFQSEKPLQYACAKCPLGAFGTRGELGCIRLLAGILPKPYFLLNMDRVRWHTGSDKIVRRQLTRIRDKIKALPKRRKK